DLLTTLRNIILVPFYLYSAIKTAAIIIKEKPDIIINDFEPFTAYIGKIFFIPLIEVNNNQVISKGKIAVPKESFFDYIKSRIILKIVVPIANKYIISSFFEVPLKSKKAVLVAPILRKEVKKLKPQKKDYVLVYQTSKSNSKLLHELKKIDQEFIIYGFNIDKKEANLNFRAFDNKQFYKDLANCKAIITNGGFTLITEAIYLKKPILSIPIKKQFEQMTNALYVEKLGFGKKIKEANKKDIENFIRNIKKYQNKTKKCKDIKRNAVAEIENAIKQLL
ncbi:MAG: glycosyltransferase family protein, partial [Candidatus Woesearchaeota archaeon]